MATKKVRVRKPNEGEQPGFISKLNKYTKPKKEESQYSDEDIYKYIVTKIQDGDFPEQIIADLEKYKIPRGKVADTAYDLYDDYRRAEQEKKRASGKAPYDMGNAYGEETASTEDEAAEDVYGDEEDEDIQEAQDGGQFIGDSIFPKQTKPYYVGADAEPYDNAYKTGGSISKRSFIKKFVKDKLKKAAEGDEVQNNEFYLPPTGTIDDPMGKYTQKAKLFAKTVQDTGNQALYKEQAQEAYNNYTQQIGGVMGQQDQHDPLEHLHIYGESLGHALTQNVSGTNNEFQFGGIKRLKEMGGNRRIRRANKALFGTPMAIPGVDVNYEFGPLGGLRKATADWDVSALGDLVKFLPQRGGNMNSPFNTGYSMISTPAKMRDKVIKTVNNQALNEVASNTPGSTATQNNTTGKKAELTCPPGATYDANKGYCVDMNGRMVFSPSTMLTKDPSELLTNPFVNPYADKIPGSYENLKAKQAQTNVLGNVGVSPLQANSGPMSNMAWMGSNRRQIETWTPEYLAYDKASYPKNYSDTNKPWVPFHNARGLQYDYNNIKGVDPNTGLPFTDAMGDVILNAKGEKNDSLSGAYYPKYIASSPYSYLLDEDYIKANNINKFEDYTPEQQEQLDDIDQNSFLATDKEGNEYSTENYEAPDYTEQITNPAYNAFKPQADIKDYNNQVMKSLGFTTPYQTGGFIDSENPDLYKFIYGGDDMYEEGGYLPKAQYGDWAQNRFNTGFQPRYNTQREKLSLDPAVMNPFGADGWRENAMNTFRQRVTEDRNKQGTTNNTTQPTTTQPTTTTTQPTTTTTNTTQPGTTTQPGVPGTFNFTAPPSRQGIFGLKRDFNYGSGFSPVNWQVPEGATGVREVAYKDRGKFWNPFDTKRVKEYYAMGLPGAENTTGQPAGTPGQPAANATQPGSAATQPGTTPPASSTSELSGRDKRIAARDERKNRGIAPEADAEAFTATLTGSSEPSTQPSANEPMSNEEMLKSQGKVWDEQQQKWVPKTTPSSSLFPGSSPITPSTGTAGPISTGSGLSDLPPTEVTAKTFQQPLGSTAGPMTQEQAAEAAFASAANDPMASGQGPRIGATQGTAEVGSGPTTPEAMSQSNTRVMGNPFADAQQNVFNKQAPTNPFGVIRRAYGGEMDYMPEYMAYGGYMPEATDGITVDQPEFSDPNYIGKVVEESTFSWEPKQLGADLFAGKGSLTGIASTIGNAIKNEKNFDNARKGIRSSDAAKPGTGQSGFGSAEIPGSNMGDMGVNYINSGRQIQGVGWQGNEVITKRGGQLGSNYKKGSVYTLTAKQIQEIVAAGGKVEYIK